MRASFVLPTLLSCALSTHTRVTPRQNWAPARNSITKCAETDKVISFFVGPQKESVINDACADMMPPCAYQERHPSLVCTPVMNWRLDSAKKSTQNANVEDAATGNKLSGWAVQCKHVLFLFIEESWEDSVSMAPMLF